MKKLLWLMVPAIALSGCASIDAMQAKTKRDNLLKSSPTINERATLIQRSKTESLPDPNQKSGYNWLLIDTQNDNKVYVDTKLITNKSNTASGYIKTLKPNQGYSIVSYRIFCNEGMGRRLYGDSYSADHKKNFQLIGFGPSETYDRQLSRSEVPIAKAICGLGGFYHDPATLATLK